MEQNPVILTNGRSGALPGAAAGPMMTAIPYLAQEPSGGGEEGARGVHSAMHSVRRNWVLISLMGFLLAGGLAAGVWYLIGEEFTATATLRVMAKNTQIIEDPKNAGSGDFALYKKTQRQLIMGQSVMSAVLMREKMSKLPVIRAQVDQIGWLQKRVSVSFPDDAEIMQVGFRCPDRGSAELIANEIVAVYLTEVVEKDHAKSLQLATEQKDAIDAIDNEIRALRSQLESLAESLGASDENTRSAAERIAIDEYDALSRSVREIEREIIGKDRELRVAEGTMALIPQPAGETPTAETPQPLDAEQLFQALLDADPVHSALRRQKAAIAAERTRITETVAADKLAPYLEPMKTKEADIDAKLASRETSLRLAPAREVVLNRAPERIDAAAGHLQSLRLELEILREQRDGLQAQLAANRTAATKFGKNSIDMELIQKEIDTKDMIRQQLLRSNQEAWIELQDAKPRVSKVSDARAPREPDIMKRAGASGAAGLAGLLAWTLVIVLWDVRKGRLNAAEEVSRDAGLPIVGALPYVRGRGRAAAQSEELAESVDAVAAAILCRPASAAIHTVMITSAISGEGKTTLAGNLARSLAGAGKQVLLIDFDLRRPSLHRALGLPMGAGVADVLSGAATLEDAIQPTDAEGLSLLTAGKPRQTSFSHMTDGSIGRLMEGVREHYDVIVVDAAPVLPVVDTRLIARHVDAVLMSLIRDRSEIGKVTAARSMLESFGAKIMGAVMIGAGSGSYYERYASLTSD